MDSNQIIDALGGTGAVAELCNVQPPSVSQWRTSGIPSARLMFLKAVRPDVFAAPDEAVQEDDPGQHQQAEAA